MAASWQLATTNPRLPGQPGSAAITALRTTWRGFFSENCLILFHLSQSKAGRRLRAGRSCDVIGQICYAVKRKWDGMGHPIRGRQGGLRGWGGGQHRCSLAHLCVVGQGASMKAGARSTMISRASGGVSAHARQPGRAGTSAMYLSGSVDSDGPYTTTSSLYHP